MCVPVSKPSLFCHYRESNLDAGIVDKADCHQIGRVLPLEKVEHLVPGSDDYNDDCNEMIIC